MSDNTLIRSRIDFDLDGKQTDFLSVPISTNESAYGQLTIPITVIKNGEGPTFSLTGGVHGDEYEGPITLMKLARSLQPNDINGRIIIIPALNLPALLSGNRCSPIDGLNLNRVFPGNAYGTVTEIIAHFISSEIASRSDIHLDLHSGGKTLEYLPSIFVPYGANDEKKSELLQAALAFGAQYAIIEDDDFPDSGRFLSAVFTAQGKPAFTCELAGAGRVSPNVIDMATHGVSNLLKFYQVQVGEPVSCEMQGRRGSQMVSVADAQCYIQSTEDGLYEPFVDLGDTVICGQTLGQIHFPQHHDKAPVAMTSERDGFIICKRPSGKVVRGDNLHIIAQLL